MSDPAAPVEQGPWRRLPPWLAPREREQRGSGSLRLVETTLLVLVGLLLAIATVNDVARQTTINHRLIADLATWRHYTGHAYHNVGVDQELLGITTHRDVVCGNTVPGPPKKRIQICLVVEGPTHGGRRQVTGGWYLPANTENDLRELRYGCFGMGSAGMCRR